MKEGEIIPPTKRTAKPEPLPPDWQPSDEDLDFARDQRLTDDDIKNEVQRFRDWAAETGKTSHDWSATWRRFVGNSRQHRHNRRKTLGEVAAELAREAEAIESAMMAAGEDPTDQAAYQRFKATWQQTHPSDPYEGLTDAEIAAAQAREAGERRRRAMNYVSKINPFRAWEIVSHETNLPNVRHRDVK